MNKTRKRVSYEGASRLRPQVRHELVSGVIESVEWLHEGARLLARAFVDGNQVCYLAEPNNGSVIQVDELLADSIRERETGSVYPSVWSHDDNLELRSGVAGERMLLTSDGNAGHQYGVAFVRTSEPGTDTPAVNVTSTDGRYVLTHRLDSEGVRQTPITEASPASGGSPALHMLIGAFPGDSQIIEAPLFVVDLDAVAVRPADLPPLPCTHSLPFHRGDAWWDDPSKTFLVMRSSRDWQALTLWQIEPETGNARILFEEVAEVRLRPSQHFHQKPNVRALHDESGEIVEVIWFSERDGWGRLYRADIRSGHLIGPVTRSEMVVQQILRLDEQTRQIWVSVSGLILNDPYRWTVCRVDIDTGAMVQITADDLDHRVQVASGDDPPYFFDSASTCSAAPVQTIRDWNGKVKVEFPPVDISKLIDAGWRVPERFRATGADGSTEIVGTIYRPVDFDPEDSYPIVDSLYPGPQINRSMPYWQADEVEPLSALGFVAVTIDGRGTPGRGREFHDHVTGNLGCAGGIDDHIAVLKQLAEVRQWMDLDRVAAVGHSAGGFAAVRAMELFPDFYRTGVSLAGRLEGRLVMAMILEAYDDPYDEVSWRRASAIEEAHKIAGDLLLVHGEMDTGITVHSTLRLVDKLIAANRDFELLIVPGDDHMFSRRGRYVERRVWDFLVRKLQQIDPPREFEIA